MEESHQGIDIPTDEEVLANEQVLKILQSNESLHLAAMALVAYQKQMKALQRRINALMTEKAEALALAQSLQKRVAKTASRNKSMEVVNERPF